MRNRFEQWRHSQESTKYPFEDDCLLTTTTGRELPLGTLLDAAIYPVGSQVGLQLTRLVLGIETATLYIGDVSNAEQCSATFAVASPAEELLLVDPFGRTAGVLVVDPVQLSGVQIWGIGTHEFAEGHARFVASAVVPVPHIGVYGIQLDDGSILTGDVWLVGDDGIVLSCGYEDIETACGVVERRYTIRVDAVGDPLFKRKLCAPDRFDTPRFLQQITFQKGDISHVCKPTYGDIKIVSGSLSASDTIMRIYPSPGGLVVETAGERMEDLINAK